MVLVYIVDQGWPYLGIVFPAFSEDNHFSLAHGPYAGVEKFFLGRKFPEAIFDKVEFIGRKGNFTEAYLLGPQLNRFNNFWFGKIL
jgi:hypothetical protein